MRRVRARYLPQPRPLPHPRLLALRVGNQARSVSVPVRSQLASAMTETELKDAVIEMAQRFGWLVHHDRPARTDKGWRTAIQGHQGFPDFVAARGGVTLFREFKTVRGKLTADQEAWLNALGFDPAETGVWRPSHLMDGTIHQTLRR